MYAQKEKPKKDKKQTLINSVVQKRNNMVLDQGLGLVGNRPEIVQRRKRQKEFSSSTVSISGDVVQRVYLDNGEKVTADAFETIISGVEIISFANRHTILGLLKNRGGAKALNTILLKPIEMQLVAHDAHVRASANFPLYRYNPYSKLGKQ